MTGAPASPPGGLAALSILLRCAARRFSNRVTAVFAGRRRRQGGKRTATPRKASPATVVLVVLAGLGLLLQGYALSPQLLRTAADVAAAQLPDPPQPVDGNAYRVLESMAASLEGAGSEALRDADSRGLRRIGWSVDEVEAALERLRARGIAGFRSNERVLTIGLESWPDPAVEGVFLGAVAVLFAMLWLGALLLALGTGNRDLGRVDWSFEWLFTLPAPTRVLFVAKAAEYALLSPLAWLTVLPLAAVLYGMTGHGFGASLGLGLLATLCASALLGAVRLWIETALRTRASLATAKNVQGLATVLGILMLYAVVFLALAERQPGWVMAAFAAGSHQALLLLPSSMPVWGVATGVGPALGVLLMLAVTALGCAAVVGSAARFVRTGLIAHGGRQGRRGARGRGRGPWFSGLLGKELLHLLRDRAYMVQTTVVPVLVIGFQLVIQPTWVEAAGSRFAHGAMMAFGIGAYVLIASAASIVAGEGRALWLLYTVPRSVASILRHKVRLWAALAAGYAAVVLVAVGARATAPIGDLIAGSVMVLVGVVIYAYIAGGIGVLGSDPLQQESTRRLKPGMVYLYLLLASLYSRAIYAGEWWVQLAVVTLCGLLAVALWQRVQDQIPYLLDPTAAPPPALSLVDGLVAGLGFLVLQGVILIVMHGAGDADAPPSVREVALAFVWAGGITATLAWLLLSVRGVPDLARTLGLVAAQATAPVAVLRGVALGCAVGALGAALAHTYLWAASSLPWFRALVERAPDLTALQGSDGLWLLLLAVVAAPLFEELLFRGLLFGGLRRTLGMWPAALGSGFVFAIVHPPTAWLPVFVMGVAAALVFARTGLLWAAVATHATYNALLILLR